MTKMNSTLVLGEHIQLGEGLELELKFSRTVQGTCATYESAVIH